MLMLHIDFTYCRAIHVCKRPCYPVTDPLSAQTETSLIGTVFVCVRCFGLRVCIRCVVFFENIAN